MNESSLPVPDNTAINTDTRTATAVKPDLDERLSIGLPVMRCRFDYADQAGQISRRDVRVQRFFTTVEDKRYLEGVCVLRGDRRTFRIDRLQSPLTHVQTGAQFRPDQLQRDIGSLILVEQGTTASVTRATGFQYRLALACLVVGVALGWGLAQIA